MSEAAEAEPQAASDGSPAKPPVDPQHAFEADHLPVRAVFWAVASLLGGVAISAMLVWGLFAVFAGKAPSGSPSALEAQRLEPPLPRLETTLLGDSPLVRARAALETERFRWLDASHTHAQVPVSRAMEIVAERGWPDAEAAR